MTPERWRQIENLLEAVVQCSPEDRPALLDLACGGDESLRQEVESFLSFYDQVDGFLERPVLEETAGLFYEPELVAGELVGLYRIERKLGSGGMGEVYLAVDTKLDRKVAIKFLPSYLEDDMVARMRLLREAKAAAKLDHPNICAVYEVNEEASRSFIVMQHVAGLTLQERIRSEPLLVSEALDFCVQIVEALAEAHAGQIVHRDIKPGNIMITERGQIKVLDFGLAKGFEPLEVDQTDPNLQNALSRAGERPGTPPYMSPEQAGGDSIDARSDLFAVGVILYECLTGTRPFSGESNSEILSQVIHLDPPQPSTLNQDVPPWLDGIVMKALQKDVAMRYQSAVELLEDLRALNLQLLAENRTLVNRFFFKIASAKTATIMYATGVILCIGVLASFVLKSRFYPEPYGPPPEAINFFNKGEAALRDGAYYEASNHFQQSITIDENFALAHARLAGVLSELDYIDYAKNEIIRAGTLANELPLHELDALKVKAIASTVLRDFPSAIQTYRQIESMTSETEKPNVYQDLGRAYENNDELQNARNTYEMLIEVAPQSPAAFLRLGVVCGKLQDYQCASAAFIKAESLYHGLDNREGLTEVFYQRGFALIDEGKFLQARTELQKAIEVGRFKGNQYQRVLATQALSSAFSFENKLAEAEQQATEAIQLAQNHGFENQAVSGFIRLGDVLLHQGKHDEAQTQYQQALLRAQNFKLRVNEAWARRQIGSALSQQHKPDEALSYLAPAAAFFQQNGYRKYYSQTLTLLGRSYRDKNDYATALKAFRELRQLGEQLNDQSQVAMANFDIGTLLLNQEHYSEALRHFDESYRIFRALNTESLVGYAAKARASIHWQLGRADEARIALGEARSIAASVKGRNESLLADIYVVEAFLELSEGNDRACEHKSRETLKFAGSRYLDVAVLAKQTLGLSRAHSGATNSAMRLCDEAVELAKDTGSILLLTGSLSALAEAALKNNQPAHSLEIALRAIKGLEPFGKLDSQWRAWVIAAEASRQLRDETGAREYASRSLSRLSEFEQQEGTEAFNRYLQRFDIRKFRKQLDHILKPKIERRPNHGSWRSSSNW